MKRKIRCLLVSLGARGNNPLIPNGKDIALTLEKNFYNLKIISSDEHIKDIRLIRLLKYFIDILKEFLVNEETILFVHMNTQFAEIIHRLRPKKFNSICTWYSHVDITPSAKYILKNSTSIATGSTLVKKMFPNAFLTHAIKLPTEQELSNYKKNISEIKRLNLVFVGRFSKVKRIDRFLQLVDFSSKEGIIDSFKFMAFDHEKDTKEKVLKKLELIKLQGKVYTNANTISIYNFLNFGDILINLSEEKGINKVMLEASALGVPVMTTSEIYYTIFTNYKSLSLVEPFSVTEAIKKLKIWKNLDLNQKIYAQRKAIKLANTFSTENLINKLINKLNKI